MVHVNHVTSKLVSFCFLTQRKEYTVARYRMLTTESMRSAMWFSFWSLVALTGVHLYILLYLQGPLHIMNYFGMFAVLLMWPDQYKWLRGNVTTRTFHSLFGMSILYLCVIGKDYTNHLAAFLATQVP